MPKKASQIYPHLKHNPGNKILISLVSDIQKYIFVFQTTGKIKKIIKNYIKITGIYYYKIVI